MQHTISHCGVVVVAAGQSKRLGRPKQLLMYDGKTLINRLLHMVHQAGQFSTVVVLGAAAVDIRQQMEDESSTIIINEQWEEGMGGSIKLGLTALLQQHPTVDGVMILVCDQPYLTAENIQALVQLQKETDLPIAACYYAQILGTPALFHQTYFSQLLNLKGDVGAKYIIQHHQSQVAALHFEKGMLDIDTEKDYQQLIDTASGK
ncbi:MAG: hypothetical protein RLY16_226 [Bacteroidota bacterium]